MKKLKNILFVTVVLSALSLSSCSKLFEWNQPKEVETEYSSIYPMSGEWWVVSRYEDGTPELDDEGNPKGYKALFTYNTAAEATNEMWISDDGNIYEFTLKCPINLDAKTFGSADSLQSSYDHGSYDIMVMLQNGKIITDGANNPSGVKSDSIYFEIVYGDDATATLYQISGKRRTGFLEDDH